jgi:hypothetical protein
MNKWQEMRARGNMWEQQRVERKFELCSKWSSSKWSKCSKWVRMAGAVREDLTFTSLHTCNSSSATPWQVARRLLGSASGCS